MKLPVTLMPITIDARLRKKSMTRGARPLTSKILGLRLSKWPILMDVMRRIAHDVVANLFLEAKRGAPRSRCRNISL